MKKLAMREALVELVSQRGQLYIKDYDGGVKNKEYRRLQEECGRLKKAALEKLSLDHVVGYWMSKAWNQAVLIKVMERQQMFIVSREDNKVQLMASLATGMHSEMLLHVVRVTQDVEAMLADDNHERKLYRMVEVGVSDAVVA